LTRLRFSTFYYIKQYILAHALHIVTDMH